MAFIHSADAYGETNAQLLDLAAFLYVAVVEAGGMIVLPPKQETERIAEGCVLGVYQDERTGDLIMTAVPRQES